MIIRDFEERDVPAANAITNEVIIHTPIHFAYEPASDAEFAAVWRKGREKFPWLAAEEDGRFLGYCKAGTWRERDAYRFTVETGVYVAPEAQRKGAARAMYLELFRRLKKMNIRMVIAGVTLPNDASVRLHEALGFAKVGDFKAVGRKFDAWHDVGFWQLDLGA
ncbi:MAG TPA: GNAT family N-acetyltransferase [Phycisphaerae bacterium]|nr:GNAT family N-acetyltransferase [Phycisphaerae bacterium]